jgi:hypothetical protein
VKLTDPAAMLAGTGLAAVILAGSFGLSALQSEPPAGVSETLPSSRASAAAPRSSAPPLSPMPPAPPPAAPRPTTTPPSPTAPPSPPPSAPAPAPRAGTDRPPQPPAGALLAVPGTPRLNGRSTAWAAAPTLTSAAVVAGRDTGITARWQLLWDRSALYLRATVHDPHLVQPFVHNPGQLFRGDSIGLELGRDAAARPDQAPLRSGDAHYLFGLRPGKGLISAVNRARAGSFVNGHADRRIRAVEHRTRSGYQIEIAIPWNVVGVSPATGRVLAANLDVSDGSRTGVLRAMKSTNPRRTSRNQAHPGTWQRLVLHG